MVRGKRLELPDGCKHIPIAGFSPQAVPSAYR
eukprot:CAMPEP_0196720804 /NCGR_PEP_ID=MMETSP1091-20130531/3505_1 /TAXON_ID=302021 /ORGANISM="Rhodomonas sp., Strain CCMP768" /LENGTH=31 /DNA_ID= /DNA_START= /DNA_END= /DNA_ORIENTATION=